MVVSGHFAAIDLGSNTFHLLIFKDTGDVPHVVIKKRIPVGIGKKGIEKQIITEDALLRGIDALKEFRQTTKEYGCKKVIVTATSAFRSAENKIEVLSRIKAETGFDIQIINGSEEAKLIYEGVKRSVKLDDNKALIMDIGGGSVEFILCNAHELIWKESFEIGGLRLMDRFHTVDPIPAKQIQELKNYLDSALHNLFMTCLAHKPNYLIGASGTFDSLTDIRDAKHPPNNNEDNSMLSLEEFHEILADIQPKHYDDRLNIEGLIPMRAEMIVVAGILIEKVLEKCNLSVIKRSDFALKEGLMYRIINEKTVL